MTLTSLAGSTAPLRPGQARPLLPLCPIRPASAPTMPQPVQTMRGPKDGTGTSSGQRSTASTASWWQSQQDRNNSARGRGQMLNAALLPIRNLSARPGGTRRSPIRAAAEPPGPQSPSGRVRPRFLTALRHSPPTGSGARFTANRGRAAKIANCCQKCCQMAESVDEAYPIWDAVLEAHGAGGMPRRRPTN
jgi:hypothetical protein